MVRFFMVIAEQMQDTVHQQLVEPLFQAYAAILRFPCRGIGRYDHIPQKIRSQVREFTFPHGKSDDVCGTTAVEVLLVQFFYLGIIDNNDGDLSVRAA